jgi:hypothetical protein
MATKITRASLGDVTSADSIGKDRTGAWTFRRSFFYRHGMDAEQFAGQITAQLRAAGLEFTVEGNGEHYAAFRGGASVKQGTHWWVMVRFVEPARDTLTASNPTTPSYL